MAPSGSGRAVGLFGLHSQTTAASPAAVADRVEVERPTLRPAEPWDRDDLGAALLGEHAVHRVRRDGHDGPIAGSQERLGDEVEDLVGTGADQQLRRA